MWCRSDIGSVRQDKAWSVTDCLSFVVIQLHGMRAALTSDVHVEQAGYQILLKH